MPMGVSSARQGQELALRDRDGVVYAVYLLQKVLYPEAKHGTHRSNDETARVGYDERNARKKFTRARMAYLYEAVLA